MHVTISVFEKYANQCLRIYIYIIHSPHGVLHVYTIRLRSKLRMHIVKKPLNAGNNQLIIVRVFLYKETYSFCGSRTSTHEHFRWSKWHIRYSFPSLGQWACFRVVKAGRILVPDPATKHCGRRCNHASVAETHACMFIHTRMHANSDTETVTCMHDAWLTWWGNPFYFVVVIFERS